jgi:hypothetical protein
MEGETEAFSGPLNHRDLGFSLLSPSLPFLLPPSLRVLAGSIPSYLRRINRPEMAKERRQSRI